MVEEWAKLDHEWSIGSKKDTAARWAPECVVRLAIGGGACALVCLDGHTS